MPSNPGMILKRGSFSHSVGEADISIDRELQYNDAGQPWSIIHRWQITGLLGTGTLAASPATIDAKVAALVAAYAPGSTGDIYLTMPNGQTATQLSLTSAGSLHGVRITRPPSFPSMANAGYVTNLAYAITAEAEYPLAGSDSLYRSFEETLSFSGGGPTFGHLETLDGEPVKQQLRKQTVYRATQQGSAVGLFERPPIPGPLWANAMIRAAPERTVRSAMLTGNGTYMDFAVSWSYEFESTRPLVGNPNVWQ